MAGSKAPLIEIQALTTNHHFREAVALQKAIWGFDEIELLPVRLFVTATKVGGQAFGAFHSGRMVAFCLSIPGLKQGSKPYLHSHMLGVLPEFRDSGIGRRLKLRQREDALARDIDLIEWTFDPLEIKNAYFNMERLGAVVRRFVRNQYGVTSSRLHAGLPTDRCTAEWWVKSDRARAATEGTPYQRPPIVDQVSVPADIAEIKAAHPERARTIQSQLADKLEADFARGLAIIGVDRNPDATAYLLGEAGPKEIS